MTRSHGVFTLRIVSLVISKVAAVSTDSRASLRLSYRSRNIVLIEKLSNDVDGDNAGWAAIDVDVLACGFLMHPTLSH